MAVVSIDEAMRVAMAHHQAGRIAQAEGIYRQVAGQVPGHAEAWHLWGVAAWQQGRPGEGEEKIGRAIALSPGQAHFYSNLGNVLGAMGRREEAIGAFGRAIAINPSLVDAYNNLAMALLEAGRFDEAMRACREAIARRPDAADAHVTLGIVLARKGAVTEAIGCFERALAINPDHVMADNNLGYALREAARFEEAIARCEASVRKRPGDADAHKNLGLALNIYGKTDEAIVALRRAIELNPGVMEAYSNLAHALMGQGEVEEALALFRKGLAVRPDAAWIHSNLLYAMHLHPVVDAAEILRQHREWSRRFADPLTRSAPPHGNLRDPKRRLRVGYVSGDFRDHVVGRFMWPVVEGHSREAVEVFCYADMRMPDAITEGFRARADGWRNIAGLSDEKVAEMVRGDGVDILVDLTMHARDCRLLVFARRPAPVQVTYLAYPSTTGMEAMDHRLTDWILDPPGRDGDYAEKSVRLAHCYWCYPRGQTQVAVSELPAKTKGFVTFGSLNNFSKVSKGALELWARIMREVKDSRLLLHARPGSHYGRVKEFFAGMGVAPERLTLTAMVPREEYFALYCQVDIALDPFPYGGGTTTCDALWMGVPVVSLRGRTAVGRGGASILSSVGLPELVAESPEEYVRIARELAGDWGKLAKLRAGLRNRMENSPLMDRDGFVRDLENAYRQMWTAWCGGNAGK